MDSNDFQGDKERLGQLVSTLTAEQIRFVSARLNTKNDREAAQAIGLASSTVYNWSKTEKETINAVRKLILEHAALTALAYFKRYALEAAILKVQAMLGDKNAHDKFIQDAATEVLDRVLGKPRQMVEVSSESDSLAPKMYVTVSPDMWDDE